MSRRELVVIDCETEPFGPGRQLPHVIATGTAPATIEAARPSWWGRDVDIAGFEVAYDLGCLAQTYGDLQWVMSLYEQRRVIDLRIRWLLWEYAEYGRRVSESYSLDSAARTWGIDAHACKGSSWRTRFSELRDAPPEEWPDEARTYLLEDVRITTSLADAIPEMPDERNQATYAWALRLSAAWGICTDADAVDALRRRVEAERQAADEVLMRAGLVETELFGAGKLRQKEARRRVESLCRRLRAEPPRTPKGDVSVSAKALRDLEGHDPVVDALARRGGVSSVINREIPLLSQPTIHTRYDVAVSGRTTSRPNLQNVSKAYGARGCFTPRPGMVYLQYDFPTLELRTLAQACIDIVGYSRLAEAFARGEDVHQSFADAHLEGNRQLAKAANFGFPGGMQGASFARHVWQTSRIRVDEPNDVRLAWLKQWPCVAEYMRHTAKLARRRERIEHLRSGRLRGRCSATQAGNTYFQGLGADVAKDTLWAITRECYGGRLSGCRVVAFIHDEYLLECPRHKAAEYSHVLEQIIAERWPQWCPDVRMDPRGEVQIGDKWEK